MIKLDPKCICCNGVIHLKCKFYVINEFLLKGMHVTVKTCKVAVMFKVHSVASGFHLNYSLCASKTQSFSYPYIILPAVILECAKSQQTIAQLFSCLRKHLIQISVAFFFHKLKKSKSCSRKSASVWNGL